MECSCIILICIVVFLLLYCLISFIYNNIKHNNNQTLNVQSSIKSNYFDSLDKNTQFRNIAITDSLNGLLNLLERQDVPSSLDKMYTNNAGSAGGGRILLALDYTRGNTEPTLWEALNKGVKYLLTSKIISPMLSHFREINNIQIFQKDTSFNEYFRDSGLTSETSNQTGHMLCALETGIRQGYFSKNSIYKYIFELGLKVANNALNLIGVEPTVEDWSRAGIIGHEMVGDADGFLGQMKVYGRLVDNGDKYKIRSCWDKAVDAVLKKDHLTAWILIRKIAKVTEIPETLEDIAKNKANPTPRFAEPGANRRGNSLQDLGLSVYGFALGIRSSTTGYKTANDAKEDLKAFLSKDGKYAKVITKAASDSKKYV